ncbi:ribonuclease E/G [Cellulosilyticum sp. I15G10I2]|uniref:ribonuclease E/G n=1 Tax=Cellulosilyticum sp. I15G10I2 TaxID=1892843 RepID=UPI00085BEEA3|nr:ribonuclease E/G [Cellulosilyticum sp. I15G10I2]
MKKIILIEKTVVFTRLAILLDNQLITTYIDSNLNPDDQNKVVVGQIDKVVKNLNAAFVDYGDEKKGLLHLLQVPAMYKGKMNQGVRLPIQIVKQNEGEKGHKLTAKINIKGKYLVCLPFEEGISISKKIKNQALRKKLKERLVQIASAKYGFIVRTHAEYVAIEDIEEDAKGLVKQVDHLMKVKDNLSKGAVLFKEPPMYSQVVAENLNIHDEIEIICNDLETGRLLEEELKEYRERGYIVQIICIDQKEELFQIYDIQKVINNLLSRKIWLKNGGNIIIDYTEALTVIDVNSAKAILSNNHKKAVNELNQLAIKEALLQILRRNLSGIIIVDLIEMPDLEDKEQAYLYAKNMIAQYGDKRTNVFPITELGLLQISRSKKYNSVPVKLLKTCEQCKYPQGEYSLEYNAYLIEKRIKHTAFQTTNTQITVQCSQDIIDFFSQNHLKQSLEDKYGIKIDLIKMEKGLKDKFLC